MLLDGETFDLVQHIDTVLKAISGHELEPRINAELMQSVLEIATPVCRNAGDVQRELLKLRAYVTGGRAREGASRRLGRHAPVQPLRAPADHRARPLPQPRRPAPVHRPPRADLRHARPRRDRRAREGDPGRERAPAPARAAARALVLLAVLARRADGARVVAADGLRRLPALGPAAAVPRLRRLRRGGRPARAHRLHRRLHAHLVGHPAAPAARHRRDPDLRRDHARRGRGRDRRLLPGARQVPLRAARPRRADPLVPPHPHDREQVARRPLRARGAGDGPRHRRAEPDARRAARPADAEGDRAACARARLGARARGDRRDPRRAGTAPTASCGSSTPTATSSRSSRRSRRRPKPFPPSLPRASRRQSP